MLPVFSLGSLWVIELWMPAPHVKWDTELSSNWNVPTCFSSLSRAWIIKPLNAPSVESKLRDTVCPENENIKKLKYWCL